MPLFQSRSVSGRRPGQHRRPRRIAHRLLTVRTIELHRPPRQPVEVRRQGRRAEAGQLGPEVVGHDEQDVRPGLRLGAECRESKPEVECRRHESFQGHCHILVDRTESHRFPDRQARPPSIIPQPAARLNTQLTGRSRSFEGEFGVVSQRPAIVHNRYPPIAETSALLNPES